MHLCVLLSMLRPPPSSESEEDKGLACQYPKATRVAPPELIILHEISQYFLANQ